MKSFKKLDLQHNPVSDGVKEISDMHKKRFVMGAKLYFVSIDESCAVQNFMLANKESPLDLSELEEEADKAMQHTLAIVNSGNEK